MVVVVGVVVVESVFVIDVVGAATVIISSSRNSGSGSDGSDSIIKWK